MAKFRVPSASSTSVSSVATQNASAQGSKPQNLCATPQRTRLHKIDKAKRAVQDAAKRAHRSKQLLEPSTVYIGNISPDVDENALKAYFSRCGRILSTRIHCSGGVAMSIRPPPDGYPQKKDIQQFGIIVFDSKAARFKARKLRGTLNGREPLVCIAISDLPEIQEKIAQRLNDYRSRLEPPDPRRAQQSALRSLKVEPTDIVDPRHENKWKVRKPFQFMGYSFFNGIM